MNRRFTILDAMALVVAVGVAFAVLRRWLGPVLMAKGVSLYGWIEFILHVWTAACVYSALAVIFLGLRRPRPPIGEVFRQPGMVACLALLFGSFSYFLEGAWIFPQLRRSPAKLWPASYDLILNSSIAAHRLAPYIGIAWMILALSGRWESNRGWIDRLGRVIGVTLLGILAFQSIRMYYLAF